MKQLIFATVGVFVFISNASAFNAISKPETKPEIQCIAKGISIDEKLACIPGLTFTEITSPKTPRGARQFDMQFTQPTDHSNVKAGSFKQRLVLLHRSENEPMVLQTSGYNIFNVAEAVLTSTFGANQLQIEHRFFANSKPEPLDWSKLDIKQSADDFHAITVAFKQIYSKPWVNTGASKGGMTSTYHRFFYPDDVVGTVADVAPLSFSTSDERFIGFLDNVGGDRLKSCRDGMKSIQIALLENRDKFVPNLKGNFTQLGSSDVAFEHSVIEFPFFYFQYGNPDDAIAGCHAIPVNGTPEEMFAWQQTLASINDYTDESIAGFMPYYFQSATQLGGPGNITAHLEHLRKHPASIDQYTPKGVEYKYSNEAMLEVDHWARHEADRVMFIYGQFDPWSGGAYPLNEMGAEVYHFWVPGGNHGSKFNRLAADKKSEAVAILSKWFEKSPVPVMMTGRAESLDSLELKARRKARLP